jgi:hypothetical protein
LDLGADAETDAWSSFAPGDTLRRRGPTQLNRRRLMPTTKSSAVAQPIDADGETLAA